MRASKFTEAQKSFILKQGAGHSGYALGKVAEEVKPRMDVVYGTRQNDFDDGLPKHSGAIGSYIACAPHYVSTVLGL